MKVMTIVGTRPEIIRLSMVIEQLDRYTDHVLVHTGQNYDYELNEVFFQDLGLRRPDVFLEAARDSAAETIGQIIIAADRALIEHQPEALLVLGDTNSCLAAIAAKRRKIPIFHMEAGNRCFDFRVPEEINRRIVDHVADINLCYSQIAREYLLREGFPADQVIVTGSPMREVLEHHRAKIDASDVLGRLALVPNGYFVISAHREENVDDPDRLHRLLAIVNSLADDYGLPVIVSTHPRTRKRLEALGDVRVHALVNFMKPFGFIDYIHLQCQARAVLSDSGTLTEESNILNFPALNLRDVHERPEGFEEAAVMMVGLDVQRVREGLRILAAQPNKGGEGSERLLRLVNDYTPVNVSQKVLRIILSYAGFVQRRIWRTN